MCPIAKIEFFEDAVILPLTKVMSPRSGNPGILDGSVHYSNHELCELAATRLPLHEYEPAKVGTQSLEVRSGYHVFGGLLHNEHFGHFLTECLSRLWAFDHVSPRYDSVSFYLLRTTSPVATFVDQVLKILIPNIQFTLVSTPSLIRNIAVPEDLKIGRYMYGHPQIRSMCERFHTLGTLEDERIYVSRSRLQGGEGRIFGEDLIERYFESEGYKIVHPENMTIVEQVRAYRGARWIVFSEGSALHLFALLANDKQRVFVIWRRGKYEIFDWQIQTFDGPRLEGEPCLYKLLVPQSEVPDSAHGVAFIDFDALSLQLFEAGFIKTQGWAGPTVENVEEEQRYLARLKDRQYIPIQVP